MEPALSTDLLSEFLDGQPVSLLEGMLDALKEQEQELRAKRLIVEKAITRRGKTITRRGKETEVVHGSSGPPTLGRKRRNPNLAPEAVERVVREAGHALKPTEAMNMLSSQGHVTSYEAVRNMMIRLVNEGVLARVEGGAYTVSDALGEKPME